MEHSEPTKIKFVGRWDLKIAVAAEKFLDELPIKLEEMSTGHRDIEVSLGRAESTNHYGLRLRIDDFVRVSGLECIDPKKYWVEYEPFPINSEDRKTPLLAIRGKDNPFDLIIFARSYMDSS